MQWLKKREQRLGALLEPRVLEQEQQVDGVAAGHDLTPSSLQAREPELQVDGLHLHSF
jgi:hypothetical protein